MPQMIASSTGCVQDAAARSKFAWHGNSWQAYLECSFGHLNLLAQSFGPNRATAAHPVNSELQVLGRSSAAHAAVQPKLANLDQTQPDNACGI